MVLLKRATVAKAGLVGLLIGLLNGCAAMDQDECAVADWYEVGRTQGEQGRSPKSYKNYVEACSEFSIAVDINAYQEGWDHGIEDYCTRDNGFEVGVQGESYDNNCPHSLSDAFFNAYQLGRAIRSHSERLSDLHAALDKVMDRARKPEVTDEQMGVLRRERKHLKRDIQDAEHNLSRARQEAQDNGFKVAYY